MQHQHPAGSPGPAAGLSSGAFRRVFDGSPVPMWIYDVETLEILAVNDRALQCLGCRREQFMALDPRTLEAPAPDQATAAPDGHAIRVLRPRADGASVALRVETSRIELEGRRACLVVASDVSGEERAQSESRRRTALRESQYRQLFETASDWYWEMDPQGRLTFVSPNFETLSGISLAELRGKRLNELPRSTIDREAGLDVVAAMATRQPFRDLVHALGLPDGRVLQIRTSGIPFFDDEGAFRGYCGVSKDVTAQVESEEVLRRSEARLRQLFERASDWYWEADSKGLLTFISPNFEAMYGIPAADRLGKRLNHAPGVTIEPESAKKALAAIKARQPYSDVLYSIRVPDGRIVWVRTSAVPMFDGKGRFSGYCGMCKDVTAQLDAERALRESERQVKQILEAGADYYWEYDTEHRYVYVSPQIERLTGDPASAMLGKRLTEVPGVSVDPEMGKMALLALKAKQPFRDFVFSRKCGDRGLRWFKTSGAPKFDRDGMFLGYRGLGADITAHVEADQAARLAQRRLHDAAAHLPQPFVLYDAQDCATAYNQAFTDLHRAPGAPTPVAQGVSFRDLAEWQLRVGFYVQGPEEEGVTLDLLLERYRGEGEHTYHLSDGRWMMVIYRALPGGGRIGLWTDVTALKQAEVERRRLEAQLQHSQRLEALGTLAGGAAHEINNALVPVIALTKMVASHLPGESRERRNLATVLAGAERSRDLVKQILAFSRKDEEERRREPIDVAAVLRDALQLMRATVPTSIRIAPEIGETRPVSGDPGQLHQVIVNLVTNAAQAIGEAHGTIAVGLSLDRAAGMLRLSVADTGCGMDAATKARIFEPFFTTKEVGKGTGLGLAVVHGIIRDHGGRIEVESAPQKGTRFDIFLPVAPADQGTAAA